VSGRVTAPRWLVADKLVGNYSQLFAVTGPNVFEATGYWDGGQLVHDDGTIPYTAREARLGTDYSLYGLFSYTGTFTVNGSDVQLTATTGSIALYVDRRGNTGKILPPVASNPVAVSGTGDDSILATTTTLIFGEGRFRIGAAGASGDFGLMFDGLALRPAGRQFFVAPVPFHTKVQLKGHLNSFEASVSQEITGSADFLALP
jgi:hypothetical protein